MLQAPSGTIRFVGGHDDAPNLFDWDCRIVSRIPDRLTRGVPVDGIILQAMADPARTIRLQCRYVGKAIGRSETPTTTTMCTYTLDGDDAGMARWAEDDDGNVTVYAFDYPG